METSHNLSAVLQPSPTKRALTAASRPNQNGYSLRASKSSRQALCRLQRLLPRILRKSESHLDSTGKEVGNQISSDLFFPTWSRVILAKPWENFKILFYLKIHIFWFGLLDLVPPRRVGQGVYSFQHSISHSPMRKSFTKAEKEHYWAEQHRKGADKMRED